MLCKVQYYLHCNAIFTCIYYTSQEDITLEVLLRNYRSTVIRSDRTHRITVRRSHIASDAILALRKGFDKSSSIRITFIGEPAVDAGGPLREFFRLVMRDVINNNSLFQGSDDSRSPAHNTMELRKGTFKIVGELFALSIVHGGPGPQCLSHVIVARMRFFPDSSLAKCDGRRTMSRSYIFFPHQPKPLRFLSSFYSI